MNSFFTYAAQFVAFTEADRELLRQRLVPKIVPAKTELVTAGKPTDALFFINRGCVRKYLLKDVEPITIFITAENNFIGAFDSFVTGAPSRETLETLEECELLVLRRSALRQLYTQVPAMNEFVRKVLEVTLMQFQQSLNSFILDSPEERYERLLSQNPHLLQRVPQHMLATWLGITPTSLSRIRKRILVKA